MKKYYLLYRNENGVDTWPVQDDETFEEALERVMKEVGDEPQDLENEISFVCGLIVENEKKPETVEVGYPDWYIDLEG